MDFVRPGWMAGCSALSWQTADGCHLWGRNFDFNRLAEGTAVTFVPRGTAFYTCGTAREGDLVESTRQQARYACLGVGTCLLQSTPVLYEGVNEKGLMGGQLYFREFASFPDKARAGTLPLQPPMAVTYLLATCATVQEAADALRQRVTLISRPILGAAPTLHWSFSDRTGETLIVESDADGLHLYRDTIGVLTNSPPYPWHRQHLACYAHIRDLDYDALHLCGDVLPQSFSGSGAAGLPGDWSSPARFVRLAFLKHYAVPGGEEGEGVARLFRLLGAAAFPLGIVRVSQPGTPAEYDTRVLPYDYTAYTAVLCAESGRLYWTTYHDPAIRTLALAQLAAGRDIRQFALADRPHFLPAGP